MLGLCLSYSWLYWTRPKGLPAVLPDGVERSFVQTPGGKIELLSAKLSHSTESPVVFAHGGMGCAWFWIPYMQYLAQHGIPCYAISARGHGESWHPTFWRMVFATTKRMIGDDLLAGINAVQNQHGGKEIVLVGHSGGGGLSQYIVNEGAVKVKGLALLGALPGTGSIKVFSNWAAIDPWFTIRLVFQGWHPNSPLSHPSLTRRAFFSDNYPEQHLIKFQRHLNRYESYLWPFGMIYPFVDARKLLSNIVGWGKGQRVLIMAGSGDKLMTPEVQFNSAKTYRDAFVVMVEEKKIEASDEEIVKTDGENSLDDAGHGVRLAFVPGAGHHLQNDVQWKVGAEKLLAFLRQL